MRLKSHSRQIGTERTKRSSSKRPESGQKRSSGGRWTLVALTALGLGLGVGGFAWARGGGGGGGGGGGHSSGGHSSGGHGSGGHSYGSGYNPSPGTGVMPGSSGGTSAGSRSSAGRIPARTNSAQAARGTSGKVTSTKAAKGSSGKRAAKGSSTQAARVTSSKRVPKGRSTPAAQGSTGKVLTKGGATTAGKGPTGKSSFNGKVAAGKKGLSASDKARLGALMARLGKRIPRGPVKKGLDKLACGQPLGFADCGAINAWCNGEGCGLAADDCAFVSQAAGACTVEDPSEENGDEDASDASSTSDTESAAAPAATYPCRYLRIKNATTEKLTVSLQYRTWTTKSRFVWYPDDPQGDKSLVFEIEPGDETYLDHDGWRVNASQVRLWAESASGEWPEYRDKDLFLVEPGDAGQRYYSAAETEAYTFTFNP